MKNPDLQKKGTEIPKAVFDLIYRVQIKRIALGYTQQDIDFFLGFGKHYWRSIEHIKEYKQLTISDLLCLADAFKCSPDDFAYPIENQSLEDKIIVKVIQITGRKYVTRKAYQIHHRQSVLLYQLFENNPQIYIETHHQALSDAQHIIGSLYHNGFFDMPKDTVEIFHACNEQSDDHILPRFIEQALQPYLKTKNLIKPKGMGRHDQLAATYRPDL